MTASQATEQAADVKLNDLPTAVVAAPVAQDVNKGNGETKDEQSEPTSTNQQQTKADEVPQAMPDSAVPTAAPTTSEAVEGMLAPAISLDPPAATQHPEPTPLPQRKPSNILSQAKRRFSVALLPKPTISGHVDGEMHVSAASTSMTAAVDGVNNAETSDNKLETVVTPSTPPSGLPMHHRKPTSFANSLRHRLSQSFVLATHRPSREPRSQELDMPSDTPAPPPRVSTATESAMQSQPQNATTGTASQLAPATQPQQRLSHPAMGEKVDTIFSQVKKRIASATEAAAAVPLSARRMSRHGRVSSDMGAAILTEAGAMTPAQRLKQQQQQQQQEMTAEHTPHSLHRQLADTDERQQPQQQQPQQQQPMLKTLGHVIQPASACKAKPATAPEITATSSAGPATTSSQGRNMSNTERTSTTLPASKRRRQSIQVVRSLLSEQLSPASPPRRSTTMAPEGPRPGAGVAVNAPAASTPASIEQAAAKHVNVSKGSHLGFSSSAGASATRGDASDTALPSAISAATAVAPAPPPRTSSFSSPTATSFTPTTLRDTITEKLKSFLGRVRSARDEARRSERFAGSTGIAETRRGPQAANGHADSAPAAAAVEVAKEGSPAKIDQGNKTAEHQDQQKPGGAGPATNNEAVAEGQAEAHETQAEGQLPGDVSEGHSQQPPHDLPAGDITHGTVATSGHQSQTAPTATITPPPPLPSSTQVHVQPGSDSIPASGAPSSDEDAAPSDRATGGHGNVYGPRSSADVPCVPALPASAVEQNAEKGKDEGEKDDKSKGAAAGWDEEVQEENK
ncbi:hypothetical protein BDZ90DRAFT_260453 [Jaminaea rosea]|uniref:Uncharacterized protein n=1 Tax=Jaminaea rosea TaxID=1569628 RepID=A0A316UW65_9BASI|nr:hypothetical protein BDZ90DRAFT_260453 [Jaminaea rosea]PWN27365.1 hypothetical protein BDZ90DRAFT_260453 [Jaminaea rosea]